MSMGSVAQLAVEERTVLDGSPEASITWTDPVTGHRGYLVIDRLIRGLASGGLRMHERCSYEEVRMLASAMSIKEALHYDPLGRYIPMGGAKGGIDCDPTSSEARGVLTRFLRFIRPYVENNWATGDDLGTSLELVDGVLREIGLDGCVAPVMRVVDDPVAARKRIDEAFRTVVDGIELSELVGGCGVAEAVLTVLDRAGATRANSTVAVQGFGTMGGATARFLHQAGLRVICIADVFGTVINPAGLPVEDMLRDRLPNGIVDRTKLRREDIVAEPGFWLDVEADVLVPAANSYCIDSANQHRVRASYVVEAANLPTTATAEARLFSRGVTVVPDVVANSGTNAWWWWTLFGDVEPVAEDSFVKVRRSLRALVTEMLDRAEQAGASPRRAAHLIAQDKQHSLMRRPVV